MASNEELDLVHTEFTELLSQALAKIPQLCSSWTNINPAAPDTAILELSVHLTDVLKRYLAFAIQNLNIQSSTLLSSIQTMALLAGTSMRPQTSSLVTLLFTVKDGVTLPYLLPKGTQITNGSVIFETSEDLFIGASKIGYVVASHGQTIPNVSLGVSDGSAFQKFQIKDAISFVNGEFQIDVTVTEGGIPIAWTRVKNLVDYSAQDNVFSVELNEDGTYFVQFGDSKHGRIPRAQASISTTYRKGGGETGIVDKDTLTTVVDSVISSSILSVTNPNKSYGGLAAEDIDTARKNIPLSIKANSRAVSADDFKVLAERSGYVAIARSFAIAQSLFLFVVPTSGEELTADVQDQLITYFTPLRQQGYIVNVMGATYKRLAMNVSVRVKRGYNTSAVLAAVSNNLYSLLSPVRRSPAIEGSGGKIALFLNDFGADFHIDAAYTIIRQTEGVEFGQIDSFYVDNVLQPKGTEVVNVEDFEIINVKNNGIVVTVLNQSGDQYTNVFDPQNVNSAT